MLKNILGFIRILFIFFTIGMYAQTVPQGINYQAIVRDGVGLPVSNANVNLRITIRESSATGSVVYQEEFTTNTNQFGLVNLIIGSGTRVGGSASNFAAIDWPATDKFVQMEINRSGTWQNLGVSKFQSVPYALMADKTLKLYETPISTTAPVNGQYLRFNSLSGTWEPANLAGANGGTVITVIGVGPITISGDAALAPEIGIQQANATQDGYLSATDWNVFNAKIDNASPAGGDLSGVFSAFTVTGIRGLPVSATIPTTGQVLQWNGTEWIPANASAGTVTNVTGIGPISIINSTTTPQISISQANNTTDGYITAADYANFSAKQDALIAGANITISGTTISALGDVPVTLTPAGGTTITGTYPNFTIETPAAGVNTNIVGINGATVTGVFPNFTVDAPQATPPTNVTGAGATTVTGIFPNFTISTPFPTPETNILGLNAATVTGSFPNYTIDVQLPNTSQATTITGVDGITVAGSGFELTLGGNNLVNASQTVGGDLSANILAPTIINDAITTPKIANNAVTELKIADGAVTAAKIADNNIGTIKIQDNAITDTKINAAAVTTPKIADGAVTLIKLADGILTSIAGTNGITINQTGQAFTISGAGVAGNQFVSQPGNKLSTNSFLGLGNITNPIFPLDVSQGINLTHAKFGQVAPVYIYSGSPGIGFNTYWDASNYIYGSGSSNQYAGVIGYNEGLNEFDFILSQDPGNDGGTVGVINKMMKINANGVGIGTGAGVMPVERLTVQGNSSVSGTSFTQNLRINALNTAGSILTVDGLGNVGMGTLPANTNQWITASPNQIYTNSLVGIGTTNPLYSLHITSPNSRFALFKTTNTTDRTTAFEIQNQSNTLGWIIGVGGAGNAIGLNNNQLYFQNEFSASDFIVLPNGGNVGIGLNNPNERLTVQGNSSVSGTSFTQNLRINSLTTNGSILTVDGLGNVGMGTLPTGGSSNFTFVGNNIRTLNNTDNIQLASVAGAYMIQGFNALRMNDGQSIAIGTSATNILGSGNILMGGNTGAANQAGSNNNVFIGVDNGYSNTTGFQNIFIGAEAGPINTTGGDNVFIGNRAGASNVTGDQNIAIGKNANFAAGNLINAIAIGNSVTATASNQVVIGNNITGLGINTAPTAMLDVNGGARIRSLSVTGSILTVDGLGNVGMGTLSSASSQWLNNGSIIYYPTSFVGIGTSAPGSALAVNGNIEVIQDNAIIGFVKKANPALSENGNSLMISAQDIVPSASAGNGGNLSLIGGNLNVSGAGPGPWALTGNVIIQSGRNIFDGSSGADIIFNAGGNVASAFERMRIRGDNGNIGIGTNDPLRRLEVTSSSEWISGVFGGSGGTNKVVMGNLGGRAAMGGHSSDLNAWQDIYLNPDGGRVVVAPTAIAPDKRFFVQGSARVTDTLYTAKINFSALSNGLLSVDGVGNVVTTSISATSTFTSTTAGTSFTNDNIAIGVSTTGGAALKVNGDVSGKGMVIASSAMNPMGTAAGTFSELYRTTVYIPQGTQSINGFINTYKFFNGGTGTIRIRLNGTITQDITVNTDVSTTPESIPPIDVSSIAGSYVSLEILGQADVTAQGVMVKGFLLVSNN